MLNKINIYALSLPNNRPVAVSVADLECLRCVQAKSSFFAELDSHFKKFIITAFQKAKRV